MELAFVWLTVVLGGASVLTIRAARQCGYDRVALYAAQRASDQKVQVTMTLVEIYKPPVHPVMKIPDELLLVDDTEIKIKSRQI